MGWNYFIAWHIKYITYKYIKVLHINNKVYYLQRDFNIIIIRRSDLLIEEERIKKSHVIFVCSESIDDFLAL